MSLINIPLNIKHAPFPLAITALLFTTISCKSNPSLETRQSERSLYKHYYECSKKVPSPFVGALRIESKYNQKDASKSTLKIRRDSRSLEIQKSVVEFTKRLVNFSDYYVDNTITHVNRKNAIKAESCLHQWLTSWANENALTTTDATKTGKAVRKWALASMTSVVLKMQKVSGNEWRPTRAEKEWLHTLARIVVADYNPRLVTDFKYFNNHDYWAALAVFSTGIIVDDKALKDWGWRVYQKALSQVVISKNGRYGYLPNEIARRQLVANYSQFALTPLVLLSYYLPDMGYHISTEQQRRLLLLANFSAKIILHPAAVSDVIPIKQTFVADYKVAWLLPFLSLYPKHQLANQLLAYYDHEVDGYSQIGGKVRPLFSDISE